MSAARLWYAAVAGICLGTCIGVVTGACATFGPAERAEVAQTAAGIEACQEIGRACKQGEGYPAAECYRQYDACMRDGGLR